jgi:hypothetical protein
VDKTYKIFPNPFLSKLGNPYMHTYIFYRRKSSPTLRQFKKIKVNRRPKGETLPNLVMPI